MLADVSVPVQSLEEPSQLAAPGVAANGDLFETSLSTGPDRGITNPLAVIVAISGALEEDLQAIPRQTEVTA